MIRLRDSVSWRAADGEVVVLEIVTGRYITINASGAVLWPLIAEGATEPQLRDALAGAYDVDEATAAADVTRFLGWLEEQRLLAER